MNQANHLKESLSIALIGSGKVGQSLAQLMAKQGYSTRLVGKDKTQQRNAVRQANVVFITTSDRAIEAVCQTISPYLQAQTVVSHCSGALNSSALNAAQQQGCATASTHPLNTFPNLPASLALLSDTQHNTFLYSEGDQAALAILTPLFSQLGFTSIEIDSAAKTHYHTACVFACNYLTALMDASLESANAAKIDRSIFWQSVQPLINATLNNISEHGTAKALSGPIARGDNDTIKSHLQVLTQLPDSAHNLYTSLGLRTLEIASLQGELDDSTLNKIKQTLTPNQGE